MLVLAAWLAVAALAQPESLLERVRQSPLPDEQRGRVAAGIGAGDYAGVERILTGAASANPADAAKLYALLGAIEFVGQRAREAAAAFRRSDALAPLEERDRFTLAMALVNLGDREGARGELERLNRDEPPQPLYLYWLGRLDYDQRRYEEAVAKLSRVVELDPQSPRGFDNLGLSLDMLGRYEEALGAFQKAVELNRNLAHPSAWPPQNLGYLLLRLDRPAEAETALRESLKYDSGFALAHYRLGRVLEQQGRDEAAVSEYQRAAALDRRLVEAYYSLGLLYRRLKRFGESQAAFREYRQRKAPGRAGGN